MNPCWAVMITFLFVVFQHQNCISFFVSQISSIRKRKSFAAQLTTYGTGGWRVLESPAPNFIVESSMAIHAENYWRLDSLEVIVTQQGEFPLMQFCAALCKGSTTFLKPEELFWPWIFTKKSPFSERRIWTWISLCQPLHFTFEQIVQFCKFWKVSLGGFSKQVSEAAHSEFTYVSKNSGKTILAKSCYKW